MTLKSKPRKYNMSYVRPKSQPLSSIRKEKPPVEKTDLETKEYILKHCCFCIHEEKLKEMYRLSVNDHEFGVDYLNFVTPLCDNMTDDQIHELTMKTIEMSRVYFNYRRIETVKEITDASNKINASIAKATESFNPLNRVEACHEVHAIVFKRL